MQQLPEKQQHKNNQGKHIAIIFLNAAVAHYCYASVAQW
jgi:hypothetical protein